MPHAALVSAFALTTLSLVPVGAPPTYTTHPYVKRVQCKEGSGTAFRVGPSRYVSAKHVTDLSGCTIDEMPVAIVWHDTAMDASILQVMTVSDDWMRVDCDGFQPMSWYFDRGSVGMVQLQAPRPAVCRSARNNRPQEADRGCGMSLNVVKFPDTYSDTERQLRALADEVASGEFGPCPQIVCVIHGADSFQVRGLGKVDGYAAIALLNLGATWTVNQTLEEMDE